MDDFTMTAEGQIIIKDQLRATPLSMPRSTSYTPNTATPNSTPLNTPNNSYPNSPQNPTPSSYTSSNPISRTNSTRSRSTTYSPQTSISSVVSQPPNHNSRHNSLHYYSPQTPNYHSPQSTVSSTPYTPGGTPGSQLQSPQTPQLQIVSVEGNYHTPGSGPSHTPEVLSAANNFGFGPDIQVFQHQGPAAVQGVSALNNGLVSNGQQMLYPSTSRQDGQDTIKEQAIRNHQEAMQGPINAQLDRVRREALNTQMSHPQLQRQEEVRMNRLASQGRTQFNALDNQLYTVQNQQQNNQQNFHTTYTDEYVKLVAKILAEDAAKRNGKH